MVTNLVILFLFSASCLAYPAEEELRPPNVPGPESTAQPLSEPSIGPGVPVPPGVIPNGPVPDGTLPDDPLLDGPLPDGPLPDGPLPNGPVQGQEPLPPQGPQSSPDKSDLKTDSSFWWRRTYYPIYYRRYYRPRSYTTYSYYSPYYSYWDPYSWW